MDMKRWTIESLPWDQFDRSKVDPQLLAYAKAASLVEANASDYVEYLLNVFKEHCDLHSDIIEWGEEEKQHGMALRLWAEKADPQFDYAISMQRFRQAYKINTNVQTSTRGSEALELVSRCVVETGTSSFYMALRDVGVEPVFREICRRIAGDEIRHYNLFHQHLEKKFAAQVSRFSRMKAVLSRALEVTDEELCFAFAAANTSQEIRAEDLSKYAKEYMHFMGHIFESRHLHFAVDMMAKAAGLKLRPSSSRVLGSLLHKSIQFKLKLSSARQKTLQNH